ncbi:MAG: two-component regulator propeller domain-containing protein, partial [Bacteroidota bacterium]
MKKQPSNIIVQLFFLTLFYTLFNPSVYAQLKDLKFEHIGVDQGLSSRVVNDVIQDKNGFLWFATNNGLHKYDGYKFTVYKNDPDDPFSISHNKINKIIDTEMHGRQTIWIGTEGGGLNAFDVEWERFINWKKEKADTSWDAVNSAHCCVLYDSAKAGFKMYYTSFQGSDKYWRIGLATAKLKNSIQDLEWIKYEGNPILDIGNEGEWDAKGVALPSVIIRDNTYHMWYTGAQDGLITTIGYATSNDGINWKKYENNPVLSENIEPTWKKSSSSIFPSVIFDGKKYHMWYGSLDDIWEEGKIGHATSKDGINWKKDKNNPVIVTFSKGQWGDKIVGAPSVFYEDSLYYMIYGAKSFTPYKASYHALAVSEDGSIWKQNNKPIFEVNPGFETLFWSASVLPFNNKYHLWYTEGGVDYASKSTSNFLNIRYASSTDLKNWVRKNENKIWKEGHTCLTSNFVRTVHYDQSGSVWIGLWGEEAGLNRIRIPEKKKWFDLFFNENNNHSLEIDHYLNSNSVYDIAEDYNRNLWIAANTFGVFKYDPLTDHFDNYTIISETPNYLPSFSINTVYCDNTNTVWCGLENGEILKISSVTDSGEAEKTKYTFQNLSEIKKIYGYDNENLILCLQDGKVELFNKESGDLISPENIFTNNELIQKHGINSIFKDNTNITWIGTDNGIIKINPSIKKFTVHNLLMKNKGVSANIHVKSILEPNDEKSDFLWIGTQNNGILKYKPGLGVYGKYSFNTLNNNGCCENTINTMFEDKQGTIWIGTPQTLNRFDPATESHFIYRKEAHDLYSISGEGIYSLLEDKSGRLWLGSENGLQWYDRDNDNFPYVMAEHVNTIYELEYDGKRVLLLGMYENGIRELD